MDIQVSLSGGHDADPVSKLPQVYRAEANTLSLTLSGQGSLAGSGGPPPAPQQAAAAAQDVYVYITFSGLLQLSDVQALAAGPDDNWERAAFGGSGVPPTLALAPKKPLQLPQTIVLGSVTPPATGPSLLQLWVTVHTPGALSLPTPLPTVVVSTPPPPPPPGNPPHAANQTLDLGLTFWPGQDVFYTSIQDLEAPIENTSLFTVENLASAPVACSGALADVDVQLHLVYGDQATDGTADGALCLTADVVGTQAKVTVAPWQTGWTVSPLGADTPAPYWRLQPGQTTVFGGAGSTTAAADFQISKLTTALPPGTTQAYLTVSVPGYNDVCLPVAIHKQVPDPNASGLIWTRLQPWGSVLAGEAVTLSWRAFAADQVQITTTERASRQSTQVRCPANASSYWLRPDSDLSFDLIALDGNENPIGNSWSQSLFVRTPVVTSMTADPPVTTAAVTFKLSWRTENCDSITLTCGGQAVTLPAGLSPAADGFYTHASWGANEFSLTPKVNGIAGPPFSFTVPLVPVLSTDVTPTFVPEGAETDVTLTFRLDTTDPAVVQVHDSSTGAVIQYTSPATIPVKRSVRLSLQAWPPDLIGTPAVDPRSTGHVWVRTVTSHQVVVSPSASCSIGALAADLSGQNLWFVLSSTDSGPDGLSPAVHRGYVGYIDVNGAVTCQPRDLGVTPVAIVLGHDGNMWAAEQVQGQPGQISKLAADLTATAYPVPSAPGHLTAGPDGNVWFTTPNGISRITPAGMISQVGSGMSPAGLVSGLDGNVWFTDPAADKVGRITPGGALTEYATSLGTNPTGAITVGPDGNLWYVAGSGVASVTTSGTFSSYPAPGGMGFGAFDSFLDITAGPDGNLWSPVSASAGYSIAWVAPGGEVEIMPTAFPSAPPSPVAQTQFNEVACACSWNGRVCFGSPTSYIHSIGV